jgi:hypothetical protein
MTKEEFISEVSKINSTGEDEFRALYNSPEKLWDRVIARKLVTDEVSSGVSERKWSVVMPCFFDSNGVEITDGCKLYNPFNEPRVLAVENRNGKLCFGDDINGWCEITEKHNTKEFWTIKN